jgi:hypothetical protein
VVAVGRWTRCRHRRQRQAVQRADDDTDGHANEHTDGHTDKHADDTDSDSDGHPNEHTDDTDEHANEHPNQHPDNTDKHSDEYADEHTNEYADEHADEHADTNEHTDTNSDAALPRGRQAVRGEPRVLRGPGVPDDWPRHREAMLKAIDADSDTGVDLKRRRPQVAIRG